LTESRCAEMMKHHRQDEVDACTLGTD